MKIVFLGEDAFSSRVLLSLLKYDHTISMVATPQYDNSIYKRLEGVCTNNAIPFFRFSNINSLEAIEAIRNCEPDLIVVAHFEKLLKKEILDIPKFGAINLHPSLLPKYRGMAPQHWPIINGDTETGVSVHYIEEGVDTGNILVQKKVALDDKMYVYDLQMKMLPIYDTIVVEAIELINTGKGKGTEQDLAVGSLYGKFKKKDAEIKSGMGKLQTYNLVRAASRPYMGAIYNDCIIWKTSIVSDADELSLLNLLSELGIHEHNGSLYLRLHDGILQIDDFTKQQ